MILLDWLLHNGIGQNISAGALTLVLGFAWSRTRYWPLHAIHRKLDEHARMHAEHAAKLDALTQSRAAAQPDGRGPAPGALSRPGS